MRDYNFDDRMTGYVCGSEVAYDFCNDPLGYECGYGKGSWGAGTQWNRHIGADDRLTLLKLRTYDAAEHGAVVVFNDPDCTGVSGRFYANKDSNQDATFIYSEFKASNGRNDSVTSVKVPYGYTAYLYQHDAFMGKEWVVEGKMPTDSNMGWECVNAPSGYDDMVSSMRIARTTTI